MWYVGFDGSNSRIGCATSPDGEPPWTKQGMVKTLINGITFDDGLLGAQGEWDDQYVFVTCVLFHDGLYRMWYQGQDDPYPSEPSYSWFGYATSLDGITWTKYGKIKTMRSDGIIYEDGLLGTPGTWDDRHIYSPTVIIDQAAPTTERYKMWYEGGRYPSVYSDIGYATSPDGIVWTKYNNSATNDPLFFESDPVLVAPTGAWDRQVQEPCVLFHPTPIEDKIIPGRMIQYEMWYSGYNASCLGEAIGYATSTDGIHWAKYNNPETSDGCFMESDPVLTTGWDDSQDVYMSRVIIDGDKYKMWYSGGGQIGYATNIIPGKPEDAFVVLAQNSVYVKEHATILNGLVGVNDNDMQGPYLADSEMTVGISVLTEDDVNLSATNVHLKMNATVQGDVTYCQEIVMGDGATIGGEQTQSCDSFPLLTMPSPPVVVPGTNYIEVPQGGYLQLPGGDYGDIMVRQNGTLVLTGDTYNIKSFDTGDLAKIHFTMATTVNIAGKFDTDQKVYFGPEPGNTSLTADDIIINVCGINGSKGNLDSTPKAAQIGLDNTFYGRMYALNGTVYIRQNTHAVGSFIGKDVIVGETTVISREDEGALAAPPFVRNIELMDVKPSPASYLGQCYPNPANPEVWIPYQLAEDTDVTIRVYASSGQLIRTLELGHKSAGIYTAASKSAYWDGRNESGEKVASGIYFYSIKAGDFIATKKLVIAK